MLSRRSFLTKSATAAAAAVAAPAILGSLLPGCSGQNRLKNFGFISGIIGKELEGDWKAVLKKTTEFGFTEIEIGDYLGDSASGFLSFCKEIGLTPVAGGIGFNAGNDDTLKRLILKEFCKYAVILAMAYRGSFGLMNADKAQRS
jgi:hypothetical protein